MCERVSKSRAGQSIQGSRLNRRVPSLLVSPSPSQHVTQRTKVVLAALHGNHLHCRVLQAAGAIALEALQRLVGRPLAVDHHRGNGLALVLQQHLVARDNVLTVSVQDDGQTKEQPALQSSEEKAVCREASCA